MTARNLDQLRGEIDRIDDAMVDLLCERLAVVGEIALRKNDRAQGSIAFRPAREAQIMRRLVERAGKRFPAPALLRMWRELIVAATHAQTPFSLIIHVPGDRPGLSAIMRDHFGSATMVIEADSASHALRLFANHPASFCLLPLSDDGDPWWTRLAGHGAETPSVIGRLPFAPIGAYESGDCLWVLGRLPLEASDDDRTLLTCRCREDLSRGGLLAHLEGEGLRPSLVAARSRDGDEGPSHLVEIQGFFATGDSSLAAHLQALESRLRLVRVLGCYPRPFDANEL